MNRNYELSVQQMAARDGFVFVTVSVVYAQFPGLSVCSLDVKVERKEDAVLGFYEQEAIRKAVDTLCCIADGVKKAA